MTDVPSSTACTGTTKTGAPCHSPALTDDSGLCAWHSTSIPAATKRAWAKKGAHASQAHRTTPKAPRRRRRLRTLTDVRLAMAEVVGELRDKGAGGNSLIYALRTLGEIQGMIAKLQRPEGVRDGTIRFVQVGPDGQDGSIEVNL